MPDRQIRDHLMAILGRGAIVEREVRIRGVEPGVAVAPADTDHAAAALAVCTAEGWRVELAGAGTWLRHGQDAERIDVALMTGRMTGLSEYEPADLTLGVRAGTSLEHLRAKVAEHRQLVPLDAPAASGATVGAMLSLGDAGPLRASLGTPRDQTLGIQVITGDGRVLRFGGRVVKNVAGYDVVRLLVGSRGTLGLIAAAFLRLHGAPSSDCTLAVESAAVEPLLDALPAAAAIEPAALELIAGHAGAGWRLLARLRGTADAVAEAADRMRAAVPDIAALDDAAAASSWSRLHVAETNAAVLACVHGPPASLRSTLAALAPVTGSPMAPGWNIAVHATTGLVRIFGPDLAGPDAVRAFAAGIVEARASGTRITVPVPPPGSNGTFEPWMPDAATLPLMRKLKDVFDPAGILGPGRFVV